MQPKRTPAGPRLQGSVSLPETTSEALASIAGDLIMLTHQQAVHVIATLIATHLERSETLQEAIGRSDANMPQAEAAMWWRAIHDVEDRLHSMGRPAPLAKYRPTQVVQGDNVRQLFGDAPDEM